MVGVSIGVGTRTKAAEVAIMEITTRVEGKNNSMKERLSEAGG